MKHVLLALLFVPLTFCSSTKVNKDSLMEGSPVPLKRAYPLSTKVNACENFHKYVCSEVEDNFKLPDDRSRWTFSFTDLAEKLLHAKKSYFKRIEQGYQPTTERGKQVRDVYLACMNKDSSAKEEMDIVKTEKEALGKLKSGLELGAFEQKRFQQGQGVFTGFFVESNQKDPLVHDAFIYTDLMTLPERSYYQNKELMKDYKKLLVEFFKTIEMDKPEKRAQWVLDYEKSLAMKVPLPKEMRIFVKVFAGINLCA